MACTPPGCRREPGEGARTPRVAPPVNLHCPFGASGQRHQGVPHFSASLSVTTLTLSLSLNRLLKNPPFTLRQAQGERREACNRWRFSVRAEPVEARIRLFQQPVKAVACACRSTFFTLHSSPFSLC